MQIQDFVNKISDCVSDYLIENDYVINRALVTQLSNEIFARLLVLSLTESTECSLYYSTINSYNNKRHSNVSKTVNEDYYEKHLKIMRRNEHKFRMAHDKLLEQMNLSGVKVKKTSMMKNTRTGRKYDFANLNFLYSGVELERLDLIHIIYKNMITNSNKVSAKRFVDAYEIFDITYDEAKENNNKIEYIFLWLDFFRLETSLHLSLIPKIADAMIVYKNKNLPCEKLPLLWHTIKIDDYLAQAYQILRYEQYIEPLFTETDSQQLSDMFSYALIERKLESIIVNIFLNEATEFLKAFYEGDKKAIDDVYEFCKYSYPIIENHQQSDFYNDESENEINHYKVKCARKIIKELLKPQELNELFK